MKYDTEWVKKSGEIYPITRGRSIFFEFSQDVNLGKRQLNRFPQSLHIHQTTLKTSLYGDWAWEYTESNLMGWSPYSHGPLMKCLEWLGSSTCAQDEQMACTPCHLISRQLFSLPPYWANHQLLCIHAAERLMNRRQEQQELDEKYLVMAHKLNLKGYNSYLWAIYSSSSPPSLM